MTTAVKAQEFALGERSIGPRQGVYVIAEAGVNHNGDVALAHRLIDVAVEAGADAVKFQTFQTDRLAARQAPKAAYQRETTDATESQADMLRRLELSHEAHVELRDYCRRRGVTFLSTPFDEESADFLYGLGVPGYKISSGDLTNIPFLQYVARKGRPMLISTGMATLGEVEDAVRAIEAEGLNDLAVLQCVSNYPAEPDDVNLRAMATLAQAFRKPVGYSDHTLGIDVALAAVALGACIVEKHFTLDKGMAGPDHRASLEPDELKAMISGIRRVERSLGDGVKRPRPSEAAVALVARKSLYWAQDMEKGGAVKRDDFIALRPASGLLPCRLKELLGRRLRRAVKAGTAVQESDFEDGTSHGVGD